MAIPGYNMGPVIRCIYLTGMAMEVEALVVGTDREVEVEVVLGQV